MNIVSIGPARLAFSLGARAAVVTVVYLAATGAVLGAVIAVRGLVPPAVLRGFLGFVLIATLAAGLEPGTAKAAALGEAGADGAGVPAYLVVGALKGLAASPILAVLWRFSDPAVTLPTLAWTPAVAVAGFCATDLRTLFDLRGRYALAIGLKQGSLAGGVALTGGLIALGTPLAWAVGAASMARLALLGLRPPGTRPSGGARDTWRQARRLLADRRWIDLAAVSVIAAASGSTDRVFGLRYLSPAAYGGYYLVYEIFSKFWLIPYVLSPILFARRASGDASDGFIRGAWGLTAVAGGGFLAATAGLLLLAPALLARVIGAAFGWPILVFAAAVVVSSFAQLRLAELQGAGRSRQAVMATGLGALVCIPLFFVAARNFGAPGLLLAWLVKSAVDLAALSWGARLRRIPG